MASDPEEPVTPHLGGPLAPAIERVKRLLLEPKEEWPRIDAEATTPRDIFTSYVMILAAIPAVAVAIGLTLFMPRLPGVFGFSILAVLAGAIVQYLLTLGGVWMVSQIIDALAPTFGGTKDPIKALKLAAYFPTALWIACAALVAPILGLFVAFVAVAGFVYSLYILYLGLPVLMKNPPDKTAPYFIVLLLVAMVVFFLVAVIVRRVVYGGMFY